MHHQYHSNSWCGPCKTLSPILEKLTHDADLKTGSGLQIDLVTVDTDEQGALAQRYNVCATFSLVHSLHKGKDELMTKLTSRCAPCRRLWRSAAGSR